MKVTLATCFAVCLLFTLSAANDKKSSVPPSKVPSSTYEVSHSFPMREAKVTVYTKKNRVEKKLKTRSLNLGRRGLFKRNNEEADPTVPTNPQITGPPPTNITTDRASDQVTTIDLTPAKCNYGSCYLGGFQPPSADDCKVVIDAQLYNSTGSLVAPPGSYVYVTYGNCATVFQNPDESSYNLQYNWAQLGNTAQELERRCLDGQPQSIGGACIYGNYLKYTFDNVYISLQRYDDRDPDNLGEEQSFASTPQDPETEGETANNQQQDANVEPQNQVEVPERKKA